MPWIKKAIPTALIMIGLCGAFHVSVPVMCDYNDRSVVVWPVETCHVAAYAYTDPNNPRWLDLSPAYSYQPERAGVYTSSHQSTLLILLGLALLALRKLPDRRGEPVAE